jgi:two-component system, chemotaxis family, CheB/CheR fusion protein
MKMAKKESAVKRGGRRKSSLLKSVAGRKIKPKLPEPKPEEPALEKPEDRRFPIVGLGASAGGLEAFEEFFSKMSSDSGMAFILVSHLDPSHSSLLPDLLKRFTTMPVLQVEDGVSVEPNHLYIIPPNRDMAIFHRTLQLTAPVKTFRGIRMPIDFFLRSLADDQGEMAICVILSGTGTDGSMGVRAVHAAGGITMVQEAATAKYDGMPRSAIDTNLADYVLPTSKMPEQLIAYVKKFPLKRPKAVPPAAIPTAIQKILAVLRSQSGHDFTFYKKSTLLRRIERRMAVHNIEDPSVYVRYLQERKEEAHLLFKELLITVTNFFRDPEAFDVLKAKVWPRLLEGKSEDYTLRVWVPGCSTGEEAYSIAMTLQEYLSEAKLDFKAQIFGTDIDEDAINGARTGVYYDNIGIDVSPERLRRFFSKEDRGYRVKKEVREMIVFAVQNVIKDAPFTKLDLVSCRNFLIYVEPEMQNRLLPLFHYSLKPGGILFLGSSESTGRFTDLFTAIDKKWKFFAAKSVSPAQAIAAFPWTYEYEAKEAAGEEKKGKKQGITELTQNFLLNTFAPPSVVVDEQGEIHYVHGQTGRYLEPAPGQASLNIISMAREGIRFELRSGLHDAMTKKRESRYKGLKVKINGGEQEINLIIRPLTKTNGRQGLILVTFEEPPPRIPKEPRGRERRLPVKDQKRALDLEQELHYTKETLQTTVEEMQATNEELKSANEELQSTNEELLTVNAELQQAQKRLDHLASFPEMNPNPVVEVNYDGSIQYLNPAARKLFPDLEEMGHRHEWLLDLKSVGTLLKDQMRTSYVREIRIDSTWFEQLFFLTPMQDQIRVYSRDITKRKGAEEALRESREDLNRAQAVARTGSWRLDVRRNELLWSDENHRIFGIPTGTPMTYETFLGTVHPEDREYVHEKWSAALTGEHYDIEHRIVVGGTMRWVRERAELEFNKQGALRGGFGTTQEITEHKRAEEALHKSFERYRSHIEVTGQLGWTTNADGEVVEDIPSFRKFTGQTYEEVKGWGWSKALHPDDLEHTAQTWRKTIKAKSTYEVEYRLRRHDGIYRYFMARGIPVFMENGSIQEWVGTCIDITERKQMEEELRKSRNELEIRVQERTVELSNAYRKLKEQSRILEAFFSSTVTPLVFLDRNFNFIRVNEAYANACQLEASEFPGHNHFEFYPSDAKVKFEQVVQTKEPYVAIAKPFTFPDHPEWGTSYWDWKLTPILNDTGEVESLVFSLEDVTERKRAEEALRESENRLRVLSSQLLTAQETERKRIAMELHDSIGQMLTAIKFKAENILQEKEKTRAKDESLEAIISMIKETIEEVRRMQMDLRPSTLDDLGVLATLAWFCREYQKIYSHIHIEKEIGLQENEVSTPLKVVLYRLTQEAMNNIAKHSQADLVRLSLRKKENKIEWVIIDNGMGFDLEEILSPEGSKRGLGLTSMRERTELSGGTFTIESTKGKGTTIRASWPL